MSLNDFVFTAEGHPLRKREYDERNVKRPLCFLQTKPPMPVPWSLLLLCVTFAINAPGWFYLLYKKVIKQGVELLWVGNTTKTL